MSTSNLTSGLNLDPVTAQSLQHFGSRRRFLLVIKVLGLGSLVFITAMMMIAVLDYLVVMPDVTRWMLSLVGYAVTSATVWFGGAREFFAKDPRRLARQMEATAPQLREDLLSAVELADPNEVNGSEDFRKRLQGRVARRISGVSVSKLLPIGLVRRWFLSGSTLVVLVIGLMFVPTMQFGRRFARAILPGIPIERASKTKVEIIEPAPPTRYVAERDAVAVIARVTGHGGDDVTLRYRVDGGVEGETRMLPRVGVVQRPDESEPDLPPTSESLSDPLSGLQEDVFAANLSVGSEPLHYQIVTGDAITLWHTLTPLPRPRAIEFEKTYQFPEYAQLNDRIEKEEHGDLKALRETICKVIVTFDQPVENPVYRYGTQGMDQPFKPIDDAQLRFVAEIPIKTAVEYQIDAVSAKSGLNNPFSPLYSITPVLDSPPVVAWAKSMKAQKIVSPLEVVKLAATIKDDLPIDEIFHEYQINERDPIRVPMSVSTSTREHELSWQWDLMNRSPAQQDASKLEGGDIAQMKLIAIDRKGHRRESNLIELLVANDNFDAVRHDQLEVTRQRTETILKWTSATNKICEKLRLAAENDAPQELPALSRQWEQIKPLGQSLTELLSQAISEAEDVASANTIEMTARGIFDLDQRIEQTLALTKAAIDNDQEAWTKNRSRNLRELSNRAKSHRYQAERLERFVRASLSLELSAALFDDIESLHQNLQPLLADDSPIPTSRIGRYLTVVMGRFKEVDDLIGKHSGQILQSTVDHLRGESWLRWTERWQIQVEKTVEDQPSRENYLAVVRELDNQLQSKRHPCIDGRIWDAMRDGYRDIRREMGLGGDWVRKMRDAGATSNDQKKRAAGEDDIDKVVVATRTAAWSDQMFSLTRAGIIEKLDREEVVHRNRPIVDLRYAADLNLMTAAVTNISVNGFAPFGEESAEQVYENVRKAMRTIEAAQELDMHLSELRTIASGERSFQEEAKLKIRHPVWYTRYNSGVEWAMRALQQSGVDQETISQIDSTRWNDDANSVRERIDRRRWSDERYVTAVAPLGRIIQQLQSAVESTSPVVEQARNTLKKYVLSVSELAKEAEEKVRQAERQTDQREDSKFETTEQLARQQNEALDAAERTLEALMDSANNADITDQEDREIARDADAAAAMIQDALDEAQAAINEAGTAKSESERDQSLEQSESALDKLAERLQQTANHFSTVEAGEDASESRELLRRAEQEAQIQDELDQRYDQAQAMAEAAQQSPQDLMDQLLEELKRNPLMQDALSNISAEAAESAQRQLEQSAIDESKISKQLESADIAFHEQKRQTRSQLEDLARQAEAIRNGTLETARQAAGWGNDPEGREQIDAAREQLDRAIEAQRTIKSDDDRLSDMRKAASDMRQATRDAAKAAADASAMAGEKADEDIHGDEKKANQARDLMKRSADQLKNRNSQALNQQKQAWNSVQRSAEARVRNAKNEQKRAESDLNRTEQRIKKEGEKDWLNDERERNQQRIAEAKEKQKVFESTVDLAEQMVKQKNDQMRKLSQEKRPSIDNKNPAAQLESLTTRQAAERLAEMSEKLAEIANESDIADQLRSPSEAAERLQNLQDQVSQDVDSAMQDLARAARHEERLGQDTLSQMLQKAAENTAENASKPAEAAGNQLRAATQDSGQTPNANQKIAEAAEKIAEQAESLDQMLQGEAPDGKTSNDEASDGEASNGDSQGGESTRGEAQREQANSNETQTPSANGSGDSSRDSQQKATQMARTLDELDQALHSPNQPQTGQSQPGQSDSGNDPKQSGPNSQSQSASQQSASSQGSQSQSGQSANGQPNSENQTAMDASQTLADMMNQQAQQAARQRLQQMQGQAGQTSESQSGEDSMFAQSEQAQAAGERPGTGNGPSDNTPVNIDGVEMIDGDWGNLRTQRADDAAESRASRVAPQYRREVQAYFQAIAKRAAEKDK